MSPSEEFLCVTTATGQLCRLSMAASDMVKQEEGSGGEGKKDEGAGSSGLFEPLLTPFHHGSIHGLDVCLRKALVVTCGQDRTVRVWNFLERRCELSKKFSEEAFSAAIHPDGFLVVVGFFDKLRVMSLLMEDLKTFQEIPGVKACKEIRFSNGGNFFACINGNNVHVYRTWTCELAFTLTGHQSRVRSLSWTHDDGRLVRVCGSSSCLCFALVDHWISVMCSSRGPVLREFGTLLR